MKEQCKLQLEKTQKWNDETSPKLENKTYFNKVSEEEN